MNITDISHKKEKLIDEVQKLPDNLLDVVIDFVDYLKSKKKNQKLETLLLSEESLKKDWLRPEEDLAWKDL
jgi:hypothetical protein